MLVVHIQRSWPFPVGTKKLRGFTQCLFILLIFVGDEWTLTSSGSSNEPYLIEATMILGS